MSDDATLMLPGKLQSRLLNVGCGDRFDPRWINIDYSPVTDQVVACDITKGLPFESESFNAVYMSHVLEHLSSANAKTVLLECRRVLRCQGILRIVVPDLERLCQEYLEIIEALDHSPESRRFDHEWIQVEMFDQCARDQSGGEMLRLLLEHKKENREYIVSRIGRELVESASGRKEPSLDDKCVARVGTRSVQSALRFVLQKCRMRLLRWLSGDDIEMFYKIGKFRMSGEVHRTMYDRHSVRRVLEDSGFKHVVVQQAGSSLIDKWSEYALDTFVNGESRKPDSLYIEGVKEPC